MYRVFSHTHTTLSIPCIFISIKEHIRFYNIVGGVFVKNVFKFSETNWIEIKFLFNDFSLPPIFLIESWAQRARKDWNKSKNPLLSRSSIFSRQPFDSNLEIIPSVPPDKIPGVLHTELSSGVWKKGNHISLLTIIRITNRHGPAFGGKIGYNVLILLTHQFRKSSSWWSVSFRDKT